MSDNHLPIPNCKTCVWLGKISGLSLGPARFILLKLTARQGHVCMMPESQVWGIEDVEVLPRLCPRRTELRVYLD